MKKDVAYWQILVLLFLLVFGLGVAGFYSDGPDGVRGRTVESVYWSLQLFVLQSGSQVGGWTLNVARFLAAGVSAFAVILTLFQIFAGRVRDWWLKRMKGHVVVAGLGDTGFQILSELRGCDRVSRKRVVAIERDEGNDYIKTAEDMGALVLLGDATDEHVLRTARVDRAERLFAVCGKDADNIEAIIHAKNMARPPKAKQLQAFAHIGDEESRSLFREFMVASNPKSTPPIHAFSYFENAARLLFQNNPLDRGSIKSEEDQCQAHLVVFGFGRMGEAVVYQAGRVGHFANGASVKLRITVVDKDEQAVKEKEGKLEYLQISQFCDFEAIAGDWRAVVRNRMGTWASERGSILTVAVCFDDPSEAAKCTMVLERLLKAEQVPVLVRVPHEKGLSRILAAMHHDGENKVSTFGLARDSSTVRAITNEELDKLAMAFHEAYQEVSEFKDDPWEKLRPKKKDSNRYSADHIPVKLQSVGCCSRPRSDDPGDIAMNEFDEEETELLARMEHRRWLAERWLGGWKPFDGTLAGWDALSKEEKKRQKDDLSRSPYLISWDELPDNIKAYDTVSVKAIFGALERLGKKVYRRRV